MSNPYFNNTTTLVQYTRATAKAVEADFDAVTAGFDAVSADVNRAVRVPVGETLSELPAAATRASKSLAFDANGQPIVVVAASSAEMSAAVEAATTATTKAAEASASASTAQNAAAVAVANSTGPLRDLMLQQLGIV